MPPWVLTAATPAPPSPAAAIVHQDDLAGRSSADKRAAVADWLVREGHDAVVIPALDSVAWLLNIRGADVARTPVPLSFAILHADGRAFAWMEGSSEVQSYESSPGTFRAFCRNCGSGLPVLEDDGAHVTIPAGTLDNDPGVRPVVHIHTASRASWYEIADQLPQFDAFPPDSFWAPHESGDR